MKQKYIFSIYESLIWFINRELLPQGTNWKRRRLKLLAVKNRVLSPGCHIYKTNIGQKCWTID